MSKILKNYMNFIIIYQFYQKELIRIEKVAKLVTNLHDETECVIHIKNLKQALNHELVFKEVHRVIEFNQNARLKQYIDMNTIRRKKVKINFEKGSSS